MSTLTKTAFWILISLAGLNQACSQKSFSANEVDGKAGLVGGTGTLTCEDQLSSQTVPVKVILVVDTSGSNQDQGQYYGTDPDKSLRGGSIQNFFNKYRNQINFSWSFITFQGSSAVSLIGNSSNSANFSLSSSEMQQAINRFYSVADGGDTPYRAALSMARQAIVNDRTTTSETKYIVVFISDGVPDPAVSSSTLQSDILGILGTRPNGKVSLSTIYYGNYNQAAADRLSMMAYYGEGGFLDANSNNGQTFQIESVIQVPGTVCH